MSSFAGVGLLSADNRYDCDLARVHSSLSDEALSVVQRSTEYELLQLEKGAKSGMIRENI